MSFSSGSCPTFGGLRAALTRGSPGRLRLQLLRGAGGGEPSGDRPGLVFRRSGGAEGLSRPVRPPIWFLPPVANLEAPT